MDSNPLRSDKAIKSTDPVRLAFRNGQWLNSDQLSVNVNDVGFTQGVTAVERLRAYGGRWFQVDRHLDRFYATASMLRLDGLPDRQEMVSLLGELIERNQAWLQLADNFGVVIFATPGCSSNQSALTDPTIVMDLHWIDVEACEHWIHRGSPLVVTEIQQPPPESWSRQIKVRCRLHYYLADLAAQEVVANASGILLDQDGSITETSLANLMIVESGELICPERDQILWGVSLQVIVELAESIGIPVRYERIEPERLRSADEVLQTGTRCGVWFANSVDGSPVKSAGPLYLRFRAAFETLVERQLR